MGKLITAGRMAWLLARLSGGRLMQPSTMTFADRHPALFDAMAVHLAEVASPRLLSFGCSTGEEVFSLAQRFADASIRGIDINRICISTARRTLAGQPDPRLSFACAASAAAEPAAHYDAVIALSVLRHGRLDAEQPDDSSDILSFARFEAALVDLDRCLRPGGLLLIWGCHFRLIDSCLAGNYAVLEQVAMKSAQPMYGADNRRLPQQSTESVLFRKAGHSPLIGR